VYGLASLKQEGSSPMDYKKKLKGQLILAQATAPKHLRQTQERQEKGLAMSRLLKDNIRLAI
jgi:hypothetical protein